MYKVEEAVKNLLGKCLRVTGLGIWKEVQAIRQVCFQNRYMFFSCCCLVCFHFQKLIFSFLVTLFKETEANVVEDVYPLQVVTFS
jgi:hypothetical protein